MRVGIRELKNETTAIVRNVRENRAEYVITHRGRPVAVLLPIDEDWLDTQVSLAAAARPGEEVWAELAALREEIGQSWRSELTAVEQVTDQRR